MTIWSFYRGNSVEADSGLTLADQLSLTNGRPSGFDYLRLILALGVIGWHSSLISYGPVDVDGFWRSVLHPLAMLIVPMFFALSGFLVAGSLERSKTLFGFLGLRVFRIMPALSVEVLLSGLILGPLFTTYSIRAYFADPELHRYFLNIIGHIQYTLPGVFREHPVQQVNGQLWTVPYELISYITLAILALVGIFRRRHLLLGFLLVFYIGQVANTILRPSTEFQGAGGSSVVMAFVAGLVLYRYRERIVWSGFLFAAMLLVSLALPIVVPKGMRFAAIPIAYITVYLGLMNPLRNRVVLSGDYSYGLFLYGFPIQQAVFALGPGFREWYSNLLISIPCAVVFAVASWWLIEKPVLGQRDKLKMIEAWYLGLLPVFRTRS